MPVVFCWLFVGVILVLVEGHRLMLGMILLCLYVYVVMLEKKSHFNLSCAIFSIFNFKGPCLICWVLCSYQQERKA